MFGFDVVLENLSPDLRKYFSLIENDFDRCYDFLFIFWPYLDKETFDCLYKYINSLPIEHNPVFEISAVNNIYTTDRILDILNVIFHYPRFIKEALELAMEYIKRKPNKISYLVGSIKSSIVYRKEDEQSGFARQAALFDIILKHAPLNCVLFFGISGFFLSEKFHVTENGRNSTILYYIYTLPFNPHVKDIRNKIWNFIGSIFDLFPEDCFNLLEAYSADRIRDNKELVELDMSFIIKIINSRLDKKSLIHCAYVHQQIKNWKVQGINIPEFDNILDSFSNKYYDLYINLKIDYFHDDFIYQTVEQFDALKRDILRMNFIFHNTRGVDEFLENYFYVYKYAKDNRNLNSSLEIIIDENCVIDFYLGCLILIKIIEKNNDIGYIPSSIIVKYFSTSEKSRYLWQIIESRDFLGKSLWKLYYFYNMNQNIIYNDHINDLVMTINNLEGNIDLYLKPLEKYQKFRPDLFPVLLHSIVKLNEHGNKITLIPEESILCIDIPSNIEIIKQFYFQEKDADSNYDYDKTILVEIIKSDKSFLYDYAERYYINNPNHNSISVNMLGLVWQIPQIEDIFTRILNGMTKDAQDYSFSEDTLNNFFSFPQENTFKFRAKYFLFEYSRKNKKDSVKINLVVDIILHSMREFFNEYLLFFLDMNHDAKFFSKIYWRGRDTFARGDVILEEIDASDWKNILSIIEKSTLGIKLIPIRRYVNDMIENYTISINKRRKERFLYLY
jgi:hypothetical protein